MKERLVRKSVVEMAKPKAISTPYGKRETTIHPTDGKVIDLHLRRSNVYNPHENPTVSKLIAKERAKEEALKKQEELHSKRMSRRKFLGGLTSTAAVGFLGSGVVAEAAINMENKMLENKYKLVTAEKLKLASAFKEKLDECITEEKRKNFSYINAKTGKSPVSPANKISRIDYLNKRLEADDELSPTMKTLLSKVPFQESGMRLNLTSKVGAKGPWQFMKETGAKYGIVGNGKDMRGDFIKATEAAIAHFKDLKNKLANNGYFYKLKEKFNVGDDFLSFITVNAYNSGVGHMENALRVLTEEVSSESAVYADSGDFALFAFMTEEYSKNWERYQDPEKFDYFYKTESPRYVYEILAFAELDKKDNWDMADELDDFKKEIRKSPVTFTEQNKAMFAALGAVGIQTYTEKSKLEKNRRGFFSSFGNVAKAGLAAALFGTAVKGTPITSSLYEQMNFDREEQFADQIVTGSVEKIDKTKIIESEIEKLKKKYKDIGNAKDNFRYFEAIANSVSLEDMKGENTLNDKYKVDVMLYALENVFKEVSSNEEVYGDDLQERIKMLKDLYEVYRYE